MPVIAPGHGVSLIHALLNDRPLPLGAQNHCVQVNLKSIRIAFLLFGVESLQIQNYSGFMRDHHTQGMQFDQPKGGYRIDDFRLTIDEWVLQKPEDCVEQADQKNARREIDKHQRPAVLHQFTEYGVEGKENESAPYMRQNKIQPDA
jgi:hypothetical protein